MKNSKAAIDSVFLSGSGQTPQQGTSFFGRVRKVFSDFGHVLANTASYAWGLFFMSFGLCTLFFHFTKYYVYTVEVEVLIPLIAGVLSTLFSIPFMLSREPFYLAVQKNAVTDAFLFDFLCLRRRHLSAATGKLSPVFTALAGAGLAAVGYFTSPLYVIGGIAALLFLWASYDSPEAAFFLSLAAFPYLHFTEYPEVLLCVFILVSLLSYVHKALLGNRLFSLDAGDCFFFLFILCVIFSGIFKGGRESFFTSLIFAAMLAGGFLAKNLIINRRLADLALGTVSAMSFPVAVFGIVQNFFDLPAGDWLDAAFSDMIAVRVNGSFETPNVFALYLLAALFSTVTMVAEKHPASFRLFFGLIFAVDTAALVLTFSYGAWVAFLAGALAGALLCLRRRPGLWLLAIFMVPYGLLFLPKNFLWRAARVLGLNASSVVYRLSVGESSIHMFRKNLWTGVGIGEENFVRVFRRYAENGITAAHSHNLLLEIGCECGLFALILFVLILVRRAVALSSVKTVLYRSRVHKISLFVHAALCAMVVFGLFDYPFAEPCMIYLFFVFLGVGGASLRIAEKEQEIHRAYLGEEREPDTSNLDIYIKK